ncbi:hypothetical protein KKC88_05505 [Patescibacteria group bacterium]|nr:hypothetical protein [Patescibacteria group bacterium]MBU1673077.1 hypothetical protein [Patescibacteria group bacterium]MBU1963683.1 hypothetical protein [Patescibacteria group bacterium]
MFTLQDAARYSITPHNLGFCGPATNCSEVLLKGSDKEIKKILLKFPAVIYYCRQIAKANSINDPLREDVLEAYWLGNDLLKKAQYKNGGFPHHSYHVWQDKPFNENIILTEKMKEICQVTARKIGDHYYADHWKEKVQKLNQTQVNNLKYYTKINKWLKRN